MRKDRPSRLHAREPLPVWRPLSGGLLAVATLPLLVVLPEAGLPIAFVALRLLATRFAWAVRADATLRRAAAWIRARFTVLPWPWKTAVIASLAGAFTAMLWWTVNAPA